MPKKTDPLQQSLFVFNSESSIYSIEPIDDETKDSLLLKILAISSVKGIGFNSICIAWDMGILSELLEPGDDDLETRITIIKKEKNIDFKKVVEADKNILLDKAKKMAEDLNQQNITFLPIGSKEYPQKLLRLQKPPRWIFFKGSLSCLHSSSIMAIVGTRNATTAGINLAYQTALELAKRNVIILSGLAEGIDQSAHHGAVDWYGQSIAILGYGINKYQKQKDSKLLIKILENDGGIVSEYLPFDPPSRHGYLRRNELQVALSRVVIPIECPSLESGTGATIRRALTIKTPVAGIIPEGETEQSLLKTKFNLENLGLQIFSVRSKNSKDFWDYLAKIMPEHDWSSGPEKLQERFFRTIERQILDMADKLEIDDKAISRFANRIMGELKKN